MNEELLEDYYLGNMSPKDLGKQKHIVRTKNKKKEQIPY